MIFIDYSSYRPSTKWRNKSKKLFRKLAKFQSIGDIKNRNKLIDDNSYHWTKIKKEIIKYTYDKCWFSEGMSDVSHFSIEHFRPKKKVEIITSKYGYSEARVADDINSYWWLAFEFKNYRLCGPISNSFKGNYFPLKSGSTICNNPTHDLSKETIVLLDPTIKADAELIAFNIAGTPIPNTKATSDLYELFRADLSIKIYGLESDLISTARKRKLSDINTLITKINDYYNRFSHRLTDPDIEHVIRTECSTLVSFSFPHQPFSKMAKNRIEFVPYQWAVDFVHPYL